MNKYAFLGSACTIGAVLAVVGAVPGHLPAATSFVPPSATVPGVPVLPSPPEVPEPLAAPPAQPFAAAGEPVSRPAAGPLCPVPGLSPVTDPQASAFETFTEPVVDTQNLRHRTLAALVKFVNEIRSVGGIIQLKSAYRPPAYQAHLQQVWDKWMQLRNNRSAACQNLRADVQAEFTRHHLIESQRPVDSSDHTRGLAFDATVVLPRILHFRHHRVTLDRLARVAGLCRPDIRHDPVHFKFIG